MVVGKEKSEEYARNSLPSNRWELFWDVFKGKFWQLVLINILMLLFCLPMILLFFYRSGVLSSNGALYPFAQNFGVGYQAPLSMTGYAESILFNVNSSVFILFPVATMFACIGVSGGIYVIRNMVWTEGIFVANDFWYGIKKNFAQIFFIGLFFSVFFYLSVNGVSYINQHIAIKSAPVWLLNVAKYSIIVIFALLIIMTIFMLNLSITYELKFRHLLKNSFIFTIGLLPINAFFAVISIAPFLLFKIGGVLSLIIGVLFVVIGLSYFFLLWSDYCQWAFDNNINSKIGAKKNRGIYEKTKKGGSEALKKYKDQQSLISANTLYSKPVKPITDEELQITSLPQSFSRDDLVKLKESKEVLYEDNKRYEEEHSEQIKEIEAQKIDAEKERQKRIEKAKKELLKHRKK